MNRRDLFRQTFLGAAAAVSGRVAAAREFPSDYDASKELARADWKPLFLDDHQDQTLIVFSEILIPATDTTGAKAPARARRSTSADRRGAYRCISTSILFSIAKATTSAAVRYRLPARIRESSRGESLNLAGGM